MKKIVCLFLMLLAAFTLSSCGGKNEKLYLTEEVIKSGNTTARVTHCYDENYRIKRTETILGDGTDSVAEIGYDDNGYRNSLRAVSEAGAITEILYTNDPQGRILEEIVRATYDGKTTESCSRYEYTDENGSYIQTYTRGLNAGRTVTVTKDEHGNDLTRHDSLGTSTTYENKYDGDRLAEQKSVIKNKKSAIVRTAKYEYDSYGNVIKVSTYDENDKLLSTQECIYSSTVTFVD